ncbi:MAG: Ig-like domain-containing protein [Candidatus Ozemobacteraceae bacterium]
MPRFCRATGFWLLMFGLLGFWSIYGCGGGGNDSFIAPLPNGRITGSVTASGTLGSERGIDGNLDGSLISASLVAAAIQQSGVMVYLESDPDKYQTFTASDGTFVLKDLPFGTHRVVADVAVGNKVYKRRSAAITLNADQSEKPAGALDLLIADRLAKVVLRDSAGNPVFGAVMKLWGKEFTQTLLPGVNDSPLMPAGESYDLIISAPGFQNTSIALQFGPQTNPVTTEVTLPLTSETNRAPLVALAASKFVVTNSYQVSLTGSATDLDGNILNYVWQCDGPGVLSGASNSVNAQWTSPAYGGRQATVTFVAYDSGGLSGTASVLLTYGDQNIGPDTPPVEVDITEPAKTVVVVSAGSAWTFAGKGVDPNGGPLTYLWAATDGSLSSTSGQQVQWTAPSYSTVATITLTVQNQVNKSTSVTRAITVRREIPIEPPEVYIAAPANNTLFPQGDIYFEGAAYSGQILLDFASYKWYKSDPEPAVATPKTLLVKKTSAFQTGFAAPGTYTIFFTAENSAGISTTSIKIGVNSTPTVSISNPTDGQVVTIGQTISFTGSAWDIEDGSIPNASLTWFIGNAIIGTTTIGVLASATGSPFSYTLPPTASGSLTVMLQATDRFSATGTKTISMNSRVGLPILSIAAPKNNSLWPQGDVLFVGAATASGMLVDVAAYNWFISDPEPAAATPKFLLMPQSASFSSPITTPGTYTIFFEAANSTGVTTASIKIRVNAPPVASLTTPVQGQYLLAGQPISFTGTVTDVEETIPNSSLGWILNGKAIGTGSPLAYTPTESGSVTVTLQAHDSLNAACSASVIIYISASPTATITTPSSADPLTILRFADVTLAGTGYDQEEGDLPASALRWAIATNGSRVWVATGPNVTVGPSTGYSWLVGTSTIELWAFDSFGAYGTATHKIYVTNNPIVYIQQPLATSYSLDRLIPFRASASDTEGVAVSASTFQWFADGSPDPFVLATRSFTLVAGAGLFPLGTHTIQVVAADAFGNVGSLSRTFYVDSPPVVSITTPTDNQYFLLGKPISFTGTVSHVEETIPTSSLEWLFNGTTLIGNGSPLVYTPTGSGPISVTLRAADQLLAYGSQTILIHVNNPPALTKILPASDSSFVLGQSVTFSAEATDYEDGPLYGNENYSWYLATGSTWQWLASGSSMSTTALQQGTNYLSVWALDSTPYPAKGISSWTFRCNVPNGTPTAGILTPTDPIAILSFNDVTLTGEGFDPEEGHIATPSALGWFVATTGSRVWVATGSTVTVGPSSGYSWLIGTRTIELWAFDSLRAYGVATHTVYVGSYPTVYMQQPIASGYGLGFPIPFQASASNTQGLAIPAPTFQWFADGAPSPFASQTTFFTIQAGSSSMVLGTHTIRVEATDGFGNVGSTSRNLYVNASPSAIAIIYPASGTRVRIDTDGMASFTGTFSDLNAPDDIFTTTWYCDGIPFGQVVNNTSPTTISSSTFFDHHAVISSGPHTIRFEVRDMLGVSTYTELAILIDREPHITLATCTFPIYAMGPKGVPVYLASAGVKLLFDGAATDYELNGNPVPNSSFTWFVDVLNEDNPAYSGRRPATTSFPLVTSFEHGVATITLQALDSWGVASQATFSIRIWDALTINGLTSPETITYRDKQYFVTEPGSGRIQVLNTVGTLGLLNIYASGTPFTGPFTTDVQGVAAGVASLYILESTQPQINIATGDTSNGILNLEKSVGKSGTLEGDNFSSPNAVDLFEFLDQTFLYVADTGNNRIRRIYFTGPTPQWNNVDTLTKTKTGLTGSPDFLGPRGIRFNTVGASNFVYVADTGNNRVVRMDESFNYSLEWAVGDPRDIAFANTDNKSWAFVSNTTSNKIEVFKRETGEKLMEFGKVGGGSGNGLGEFDGPMGIYCKNNFLYIVENGGNRIQCIRSGAW